MKVTDFINKDAIEEIKEKIEDSGGNEVFFRGIPDDEGKVAAIEVIARGNTHSVAALLNMMRKNEVIIHNHPSGSLVPSNEDINVSGIYGNSGGASYIVNNSVTDIYVIVPLKQHTKIAIDEYFGKDGIIRQKAGKFEIREEQQRMSSYIAESMNNNRKLIVEAGTGTGKTIAYLLPTLLYTLENSLKLIISTNTINLQEQLINKDIPMIEGIIGREFTYEIVKGRGNYLCKRKLHNINAIITDKDTEEERAEKMIFKNLLDWDSVTRTGDRGELKYALDYRIWEQVQSETDTCMGVKCQYYSSCHFFKARKNTAEVDMLILNHHMFFADLSIRNEIGFNTDYSILPNYDIVVFDEAHNIEDTARNYFTYEISRYSFGKLMGHIYNKRAIAGNNAGVFIKLIVYLNENLSQSEYLEIDEMKEEIIDLLNSFYDKGNEIFDRIMYPFAQKMSGGEIKERIDRLKVRNVKYWMEVVDASKEFAAIYAKLIRKVNGFLDRVNELDLEDENGIAFDFARHYEKLKAYYRNFRFVIDSEDKGYVYWLDIIPSKGNIKLFATPFDISSDLKESLFDKMERMVFTSATLAVDNKFSYFKESIGLLGGRGKKPQEVVIESPFDYERQMKVYIPEDIPDPNNIEFLDEITGFTVEMIRKTEGHCFLLFTSYSAMNYLYGKIRGHLDGEGYTLLKQNDYPRHEMIEIFRNSRNPVLFGTDSFWEGVDVQGDQLRSVMIIKLPFKVPNDPVTEAIIENIRERGKSPFNDYQVPQAVIKFKQGIGRLIRSKEDMGIITVLDNRIIKKSYGRKFLKVLPRNMTVRDREKILKAVNMDQASSGNGGLEDKLE